MVVRQSTNGTSATTTRNSSGRRLVTAPMRRPPALPPRIASCPGVVQPCSTRWSAQATKSVKVLRLCSSLPSSYHARCVARGEGVEDPPPGGVADCVEDVGGGGGP